jgi:hypothetical protein
MQNGKAILVASTIALSASPLRPQDSGRTLGGSVGLVTEEGAGGNGYSVWFENPLSTNSAMRWRVEYAQTESVGRVEHFGAAADFVRAIGSSPGPLALASLGWLHNTVFASESNTGSIYSSNGLFVGVGAGWNITRAIGAEVRYTVMAAEFNKRGRGADISHSASYTTLSLVLRVPR